MIGQIIRYGLVGGAVTALQAGVYWMLGERAGWHPQIANIAGYVVAVAVGYFAHGAVTFRNLGVTRSSAGQAGRFLIVSLFSLALNATWVWATTRMLALPLWTPIPLMATVTPAIVFVLNRQWVYR